jgi:hypothetical protein
LRRIPPWTLRVGRRRASEPRQPIANQIRAATAILDRLLNHSPVITIRGDIELIINQGSVLNVVSGSVLDVA